MYSSPAIDYLIRKKASRKTRFVIQSKIIFLSYASVAVYLLLKYFGSYLYKIEPIVYGSLIVLAYSVYYMISEKNKLNSGGSK